MPGTNLVALQFAMGYQGGTIHQMAEALRVSTDDILNADDERMGELLRKAQERVLMILTRRKKSQSLLKDNMEQISLPKGLNSFHWSGRPEGRNLLRFQMKFDTKNY